MNWISYFIQGIEILFLGIGSYFDLKEQKIPAWNLVVFGVIGILGNLLFQYQKPGRIFGGICVGGILLIVGWLSKEELGYGDGIGVMILGIFEGWKKIFPVLLTAFFLSSIWGVFQVFCCKKSKKETMPFFPFLLISFLGGIFI